MLGLDQVSNNQLGKLAGGPAPIAPLLPQSRHGDEIPPDGVSFVIPVYNKAAMLPAVIAAIGEQQGGFPREFIFIDDGSTDESRAVIERETEGWHGVVLHTQPNAGSAAATNAGIARAQMPFIKFVDADDLLSRDATLLLLNALKADEGAVLAYGGRRFFKPGEKPDLSPAAFVPGVSRSEAPLRAAMRNSLFNPTQFLARTGACRESGGCDERVVFSQEYSLTLRLARRGAFLKLDRTLAYLLDEDVNRLSNNKGRQLQRVTRAVRHFLEDHPETSGSLQRFACRRAASRAMRYARRDLGFGRVNPWLGHYLRGHFGLWSDPVAFIRACETVYDTPIP